MTTNVTFPCSLDDNKCKLQDSETAQA